jgi:hypothetical protein
MFAFHSPHCYLGGFRFAFAFSANFSLAVARIRVPLGTNPYVVHAIKTRKSGRTLARLQSRVFGVTELTENTGRLAAENAIKG